MIYVCDRCKKEVDGFEDGVMTAGFYRIEDSWKEYANEGEKIICDDCMFKDERYIKVYGNHYSGYVI
jgi:hypothetical protein